MKAEAALNYWASEKAWIEKKINKEAAKEQQYKWKGGQYNNRRNKEVSREGIIGGYTFKVGDNRKQQQDTESVQLEVEETEHAQLESWEKKAV